MRNTQIAEYILKRNKTIKINEKKERKKERRNEYFRK
jgi:hypothetical protein